MKCFTISSHFPVIARWKGEHFHIEFNKLGDTLYRDEAIMPIREVPPSTRGIGKFCMKTINQQANALLEFGSSEPEAAVKTTYNLSL